MRLTPVRILAWTAVGVLAQAQDLTRVLSNNPNLTLFTDLLRQYADLNSPFSSLNHITVLAPSNAAFERIPASDLGPVFASNDTDTIRAIIEYHILNGTLNTGSLSSVPSFLPSYLTNVTYSNTTGGTSVHAVRQAGDTLVLVSGLGTRSTIIERDLAFSGGTVQVIDTFLTPPQNFMNTTRQFNLTSAGGAIARAKLNDTLDNVRDLTIFVPNNDAFQRIGTGLTNLSVEELAKIFGYHYINGSVHFSTALTNNTVLVSSTGKNLTVYFGGNSLYINNAKILQQDILLSNGVMHVLDNILSYNATTVYPNFEIPSQPPMLPGSRVDNLPYTSDFPTTITSAPSDLFTKVDSAIITAAATTDNAATPSTTGDGSPTKTSKAGAADPAIRTALPIAAIIGGAVLVVAAL